MHYRGIAYSMRERAPGEWEWVIRTPVGSDKSGVTRGTQRWAETVIRRGIDIWWLVNPQVSDVPRAAE